MRIPGSRPVHATRAAKNDAPADVHRDHRQLTCLVVAADGVAALWINSVCLLYCLSLLMVRPARRCACPRINRRRGRCANTCFARIPEAAILVMACAAFQARCDSNRKQRTAWHIGQVGVVELNGAGHSPASFWGLAG